MTNNREEEIKAAIVVKADEISFATPAMNRAAEALAFQLHEFVNFIHSLDDELTRVEVTYLTAGILENLPGMFEDSPELIKAIKKNAEFLKSKRHEQEKEGG